MRKRGKPVVLVANKAEARGAAGRHAGGLGSSASASRCRSRPNTARACPTCATPIVEALGEERAFGDDEDEDDDRPSSEPLIGEDIADPDAEPAYDDTKPMRIAVVGRPNAGKSTLINALIGEERLLTGPEAGITRDSISVDWDWRGRQIKLFDTAGMRRKAQGAGEARKAVGRRRPARHPLRRGGGRRASTRPSPSRSRICRSPT